MLILFPPAGSFGSTRRISVDSLDSLDSLAELRAKEHAGSLSSLTAGRETWRRGESGGDAAERKVKFKGHQHMTDRSVFQ